MSKLIGNVQDLVEQNWLELLIGVGGLVIGRFWGFWRARRSWRERDFLDRLMVSLNGLREVPDGEPVLRIRTLLEKDLREVLLNDLAVRKVLAAAARTTERDPILPLAPEDRWYLLNAVLNEIAEHFAQGSLMQDMGVPTASHLYLVCLTRETAGEVRTQKIRAMVVRKDLLCGGAFHDQIDLERANHATRLRTLAIMAERYESDPECFLEVELAVPLP